MSAEPAQPPLKVCPHCSVASRTGADTCPSCGKSYERRAWRWWFAIPIAAVAFGAGYFGWQVVTDDEPAEPKGLTIQEARKATLGTPPARIERLLDNEKPSRVRHSSGGGNDLVCRLYLVVDQKRSSWEFCFLNGELEISRPHRF